MQMTPAIKGQLTKADNAFNRQQRFSQLRKVFSRHMPTEQAKHATRAYMDRVPYGYTKA
jgi:hypothetical protein